MVRTLNDFSISKLEEPSGALVRSWDACVRLNQTPEEMVQTLQANHVHGVACDYQTELIGLCHMLNIEPIVLDD